MAPTDRNPSKNVKTYERDGDNVIAWTRRLLHAEDPMTIAVRPTGANLLQTQLLEQMITRANLEMEDDTRAMPASMSGKITMYTERFEAIYNELGGAISAIEGYHEDENVIEASAALGRIRTALEVDAAEAALRLNNSAADDR